MIITVIAQGYYNKFAKEINILKNININNNNNTIASNNNNNSNININSNTINSNSICKYKQNNQYNQN